MHPDGRGRRVLPLCTLLLVVANLGACAQPAVTVAPAEHPTDGQAREYLSRVSAMADAGNVEGVCKFGTGNCLRLAETLGARHSRPAGPPTVVASLEVPDAVNSDGSVVQGGRLLLVCGMSDKGVPYRSSMLFFGSSNDSFTVIEPLYWVGSAYQVGNQANASADPSGPWASCPGS
jgi:hypothetical protein